MTCTKCLRVDPPCGFYATSNTRQCRDCQRAAATSRYRAKAADPEWVAAERERARLRKRTHSRNTYRKRKRLLTEPAYHAQLTAQGGGCAICHRVPVDAYFPIDHDHVTGAIRGVLCVDCNLMLGRAHDDVTVLAAAIEYLTHPPYTSPEGTDRT